MRYIPLLLLLTTGCVSVREAKRYGEVRYCEGRLDQGVEKADAVRQSMKLDRITERLKAIEKRLDVLEVKSEPITSKPLIISTGTPYITFDDFTLGWEIYYCKVCGKAYTRGNNPGNCAVNHGVNDCCHYGDREMKP